jgi:hypothetical protein
MFMSMSIANKKRKNEFGSVGTVRRNILKVLRLLPLRRVSKDNGRQTSLCLTRSRDWSHRKSFPTKVSADTLRKLGIAPNNESYVINTLRFIGAIDADGNKTEGSTTVFNHHELAPFQKAFGEMVKTAYTELFALHKDEAWELDLDGLISFFRTSDQTSDLVGRRQASTFQALASLAGHGEIAASQKQSTKPREIKQKGTKAKAVKPTTTADPELLNGATGKPREVGLTVRIEVNLPVAADQETYDRIFRSIRENLLNAQ